MISVSPLSTCPDEPLAASEAPWIGYFLSQAATRIRTLTAAALEPLGLTPPMLRALEAIEAEQPLTQARLGLRVHMDRTTVVHVVDRFEALGYARRAPDPADRRSHALTLTAEGAAALDRARQLARGAEDTALAALSADERDQLVSLLRKIHQPTPYPEETR
jgi:DNA-binding MarR family transcriptional regulator